MELTVSIEDVHSALQTTFTPNTSQLSNIFHNLLSAVNQQLSLVKSQQEEIDALKSEINTLKSKIVAAELLESKVANQQSFIDNLPDYIKSILFPGMQLKSIQDHILKSSELFDLYDLNGGATTIIKELKEYNINMSEGKSLKSQQIQLEKDILVLRDTVNWVVNSTVNGNKNLDDVKKEQAKMNNDISELNKSITNTNEKADHALFDIRTLESVFGIPSSRDLESQPSLDHVKQAKNQFDKTAWKSITQLWKESSETYPTNDNSSIASVESVKGEVLNELKSYISLNIVNPKVLPIYQETSEIKSDLSELETKTNENKEKLEKDLIPLNNQLLNQEQDLFTLKNQLQSQENLILEKFNHLEKNNKQFENNISSLQETLDSKKVTEEEFEVLSKNVEKISIEQASNIANMVYQLRQIETDMSSKPSVDSMIEMIKLIENTFKQQLGENVVGLKSSVGKIVKAVQDKASKDEVMNLVASQMQAMQGSSSITPAGALACISCGNRYLSAPFNHNGISTPKSNIYKTRPKSASSLNKNKSYNALPTQNLNTTFKYGKF